MMLLFVTLLLLWALRDGVAVDVLMLVILLILLLVMLFFTHLTNEKSIMLYRSST